MSDLRQALAIDLADVAEMYQKKLHPACLRRQSRAVSVPIPSPVTLQAKKESQRRYKRAIHAEHADEPARFIFSSVLIDLS